MKNSKNVKKVLFLSRPFLDSNSGTGEQAVAREVAREFIQRSDIKFKHVHQIIFAPYHKILSLIFYDFVVTFVLAIKNLIWPHSIVIFNSPYQVLFIPIYKLRSYTVCLVQDFFFMDYGCNTLFNKYTKFLYKTAAIYCDTFVTTTSENNDELKSYFGRNSIVRPIGIGMPNINFSKLKQKPVAKIGYIGSYTARKRPSLLFDLAILAYEQGYEYEFAGRIPNYMKERAQNINRNMKRITVTGELDDTEKIDFYKQISFLYFPTELEGFGMPLVEAMRYGVIPIVNIDAKIPHLVKSHCQVVKSPSDAMKLIVEICNDSKHYGFLIKDNYDYSKQFNWRYFVDAILSRHTTK